MKLCFLSGFFLLSFLIQSYCVAESSFEVRNKTDISTKYGPIDGLDSGLDTSLDASLNISLDAGILKAMIIAILVRDILRGP